MSSDRTDLAPLDREAILEMALHQLETVYRHYFQAVDLGQVDRAGSCAEEITAILMWHARMVAHPGTPASSDDRCSACGYMLGSHADICHACAEFVE